MPRQRDEAAYDEAVRRWVLPECLHVPVAAVDEAAIAAHIGDIVQVISPGRAVVVAVNEQVERDLRLPIWEARNAKVLFEPLQVWVAPRYTRYRQAYRKAKPHECIAEQVLAHALSRDLATMRGFGFVRIVPVSRGCNSSSAATERWAIGQPRTLPPGQRIRYADISDIMVIMDMYVGGGVMENVRVAQHLVEVPGVRIDQSRRQAHVP